MSNRALAHNRPVLVGLRVVIAIGLAIDAFVHVQLAANYQIAYPGGMGGGTLFWLQAAAAVLAAFYVLLRGSRLSYLVAAVVALSAFAAVVVSTYVQLPAIGPIPAMYEPIWFFEKALSAVAEGAAGVLAVVGMILVGRRTPEA
ncbi:hypothetical protein ACX80Z_05140 [Arthrobacter sp. TMT4-20]